MIKKTTTIVAVVLFVILFTAGTVAAGLALRSTTTVDENDMDNEYIVLTSTTGYKDFLGTAAFDTTNNGGVLSYTLRLDTDFLNDGIKDASLVSEKFTMNVEHSAGEEGLYNLEITVDEFIPIGGLEYIFTAGPSTNEFQIMDTTYSAVSGESKTYTWTLENLSYDVDYIIALYVSGTPTETPGATLGFTNYDGSASPAVTGSVFTFSAVSVA